MPGRAGGVLAFFFDQRTAEPVNPFADANGTIKLSSPVISDPDGWFMPLWLPAGLYRLALVDHESDWGCQKEIVVVALGMKRAEPSPTPKPEMIERPKQMPEKTFEEALEDLLVAYAETPRDEQIAALELCLSALEEAEDV